MRASAPRRVDACWRFALALPISGRRLSLSGALRPRAILGVGSNYPQPAAHNKVQAIADLALAEHNRAGIQPHVLQRRRDLGHHRRIDAREQWRAVQKRDQLGDGDWLCASIINRFS
jgi:hypothetical protein